MLEAMSGEAIDELVERAFRDGDTDRDGRWGRRDDMLANG